MIQQTKIIAVMTSKNEPSPENLERPKKDSRRQESFFPTRVEGDFKTEMLTQDKNGTVIHGK